MIQEIRSINDDFRIQPYPFPIEELSSSPRSTSNSVRTSMRRMRTETPSHVSQMDEQNAQALFFNLEQALKEEKYAEGLQLIKEFEIQWNGELFERFVLSVQKEIPIVDRSMLKELGDASIQLSKAYFLAMEKDREAMAAFDDGMAHLRLGVEKVIELLESMGASRETTIPIQEELNSFEPFYKGFLELALGDHAEAAAHFREFHALYMEGSDLDNDEVFQHLLTLRIIEKQIGEEILPVPTTVDESDPGALLIAGRFDEALAILDLFELDEIYVPSLPLIFLLKGEISKAKAFCSEDLVDYALLLILLQKNREI